MKKVNAWIGAPPTTDHDPASAIPDKKRSSVILVVSCLPIVLEINNRRNIFCYLRNVFGINSGISLVIIFAEMVALSCRSRDLTSSFWANQFKVSVH